MSTDNAGLAKELGYTNIRVFLAGEPAWSDAGYPVYASNEFVEKGNIVLLDLRQGDAPVKGRIPRSIPITYEQLEERMGEIQAEVAVLDERLADPELWKDHERITKVRAQHESLQAELGEIEEEWLRKAQ